MDGSGGPVRLDIEAQEAPSVSREAGRAGASVRFTVHQPRGTIDGDVVPQTSGSQHATQAGCLNCTFKVRWKAYWLEPGSACRAQVACACRARYPDLNFLASLWLTQSRRLRASLSWN